MSSKDYTNFIAASVLICIPIGIFLLAFIGFANLDNTDMSLAPYVILVSLAMVFYAYKLIKAAERIKP